RRHVRPAGGLDVHAVADGLGPEARMDLGTEGADHPAVRRPRQAAAQLTEADPRWLARRSGRRHLGDPALLGRQITDEGLQATCGLGELPDHALVIGTLVPDLGEDDAASTRFPVHLGLLSLGLGSKGGQLLLACFFPFFSIRKAVRSYTIL